MPAPLSKDQKRDLVMRLLPIYREQIAPPPCPPISASPCLPSVPSFDDWRRSFVRAAVHKDGLRCCDQGDYAGLRWHIASATGDVEGTFYWGKRVQGNPKRIARWKLNQALRDAGLSIGYAAVICKNKFKCAIDEASESQLWSLFYDIQRAAKRSQPKAD